jgi:hypothetical protein
MNNVVVIQKLVDVIQKPIIAWVIWVLQIVALKG